MPSEGRPHGCDELVIDKRHTHFEAVRHRHRIDVTQKLRAHVDARFEPSRSAGIRFRAQRFGIALVDRRGSRPCLRRRPQQRPHERVDLVRHQQPAEATINTGDVAFTRGDLTNAAGTRGRQPAPLPPPSLP